MQAGGQPSLGPFHLIMTAVAPGSNIKWIRPDYRDSAPGVNDLNVTLGGLLGRVANVAPHPLAVNRPPHLAVGVLVTQLRGQPRLAHVVVAVQRGKAQQVGRDADGREAGVAGGGEWAAMQHGRADQKACWHFVVEQVNMAFRRIGLIFPLEAEGDNPDWATIWWTVVGMPAAA